MDAEKLLAQVRKQPWKQPCLIPPHARQGGDASAAEGVAAVPAAAPAASISTAALLSGQRQAEILDAALRSADAPDGASGSAAAA